MKSFTPMAGLARSRAFLASLLTCIMLVAPLTPIGFASTIKPVQGQSKGAAKQSPATKAGSPSDAATRQQKDQTVTPSAVSITASKTDNRTAAQPVGPTNTINYSITITNGGSTDALGVMLNDIIDSNTTLVGNSIQSQPQARNDAYTTVGNTLLEVGVPAGSAPAVQVTGSVFDNDANATGTRSLASFTQPANGTLNFNTDGTFTYLPNANFRGPTDTFTYTIKNDEAPTLTDTATVTITISQMVWYVDNSYAGANGTADGRSTRPYTSLTPLNNSASDVDAAGDIIYLFTGNAAYTTGLALENTQQFIGNGVALVVTLNATPTTLRTAGARPTLSNGTGNALTLANDTTTQGLNLTAAANAAIFGSGVSGTINVSDLNINTSGSGSGVSLTNQAGTFNYSGGGGSTLTGNSTGTAVLISGGNGNINFSGVPVSQNNGRAVDIQTRAGGTVTFNNGSTVTQTAGSTDSVVLRNNTGGSVINFSNNVSLTTNAGRGLQTDNSTGNFTLNMNAAGNSINATGGAAIDVEDIVADLDFTSLTSTNSTAQGVRVFNLSNTPAGRSITVTGTTTVTNSAGTGVLVDSNAAAVTFATLNSTPAVGQISVSIVSNTGTTTATGGTVMATDATAINVLNSALNMTFSTITVDNTGDADNCVTLDGMTGTLTLSGGSMVGGNSSAFRANAQNGSITYNGTISQSNAFRAVDVTNKSGGTVNFGGQITASNGAVAGAGVFLNANTGTTFNFTGGLNLSTGVGAAFTATGGGTVNVCDESPCNPAATGALVNTLTTTSGVALTVTNTTIGANKLEFRSISANGATKGISLNNTGSGGLTVLGTGTTAGSGGTIQNISQRGAEFISASNISLKNMNFTNANTVDAGAAGVCDDTNTTNCNAVIHLNNVATVALDRLLISGTIAEEGINGNIVSNLTLSNSTIGASGQMCGNEVEEGCFKMRQLTGTSSITASTLRFAAEDVLEIANSSGSLTFNVDGSTFSDTQPNPPGSTGMIVRAGGTSSIILNVTNSNFLRIRSIGLNATAENSATLDADISTSTFDPGTGTMIGIALASNNTANMLFNIQNNPTVHARGGGAISVLGDGTSTFTGRIQNNPSVRVLCNGAGCPNGGVGTPIAVQTNTNAVGKVTVANNTVVTNGNDQGIAAIAGGKTSGLNGTLDVTITGNNITTNANALYDIETRAGGFIAGDQNIVCANVANNTASWAAQAAGITAYRARVGSTGAQLKLQGFNTNAATTWINNGNTPANAAAVSQSIVGGGQPITTCTAATPNNPALDADTVVNGTLDSNSSASSTPVAQASATQPSTSDITARPFVGMPQQPQLAKLATLGDKAATGDKAALTAAAAQQESSRISATKGEGSKKAGTKQDVVAAASSFPINIGTLQAGESVTINFSVTVNNPLPSNVTQISNQGRITGTNFSEVFTDDPDVAGTNNPTVTNVIPMPTITVNNASVPEPQAGSVQMPFSVVLSGAYTVPVSVNFQTADGTATAGTDYTSTSGTVDFPAGNTFQTIAVPVLSDGDTSESDENFTVTLSAPVNGTINGTGIATGTITAANPAGTVLISEVRTSGPGGANDEFVELYNNTDATIDISGWALVKSGADCTAAPVVVAVVPASRTIPARGHYLIAGSAYGLGSQATPDQTLLVSNDIEDDRSLALFNTATPANFNSATRRDAVGFGLNTSNNCTLLYEGSTLNGALGSVSQYSFARNLISGLPKDTNNGNADFIVVSTTPATMVGDNLTPILGAPGPEATTSPIQRNAVVKSSLIDPMLPANAPPNRVRSSFGANSTNAAFGTLSIQRRFKNTLGVPVTRLRFRIVDLTTLNNRAAGQSDLRVLSSNGMVKDSAGNTVVTVNGLTLEGPPQPNGGGLNSTLTVVLPGGGLAPGNTIDVQFLLGVQEQGNFSFFVNTEALPGTGTAAEEATRATKGVTGKQPDAGNAGGAAKPDKE